MKITFVGGGSAQWVPTLLDDIALTPSLADAEVVLYDISSFRVARTGAYGRHLAKVAGVEMNVVDTVDRDAALDGADFVVVCISTGGLESMAHDLEVPARFGIVMPTGDTIGPSGISRSLRNIPVMLELARAVEARCPAAWLLNLTNPMTTLCRTVTKHTGVKTIGLCHEVTLCRHLLSQLLDTEFRNLDVHVAGVNHLPLITAIDAGGRDGLAVLRELIDGNADTDVRLPLMEAGLQEERVAPGGMSTDHDGVSAGQAVTKQTVLDLWRVNFAIFRQFGALPAAGARHTVEFFPNFLDAATGFGAAWGAQRVTIAERQAWEDGFQADIARRLERVKPPAHRSLEMLAPVMDSLSGGRARELPLNLPNRGQVPDLPDDVTVESICTVDRDGARGRDAVRVPVALAEYLHRIAASQELTVEAAVEGDRAKVVEALFVDPLASTIAFGDLERLADELLTATKQWLPQFS